MTSFQVRLWSFIALCIDVFTMFSTGSQHSSSDVLVAVGELRRRHACSLVLADEILFLLHELLPANNTCPVEFSNNLLALQQGDLEVFRHQCCPCDEHVYEGTETVCPMCNETRFVKQSCADGNTRCPRKVLIVFRNYMFVS